jgi:hypothetical protein
MRNKGTPSRAVTLGLFFAWAVHDLEELLTMSRWSRRAVPKLRERFRWVPKGVWEQVEVSPAHVAVGIGLVGTVVAGAAVDGARTGGRSGFYQGVLAVFGWHSVTHLLGSVAFRGYTPGVVTAPLVVAPFSLWAWGRLRHAGVATNYGGIAAMTLLALPTIAGAHAVARLVTRG